MAEKERAQPTIKEQVVKIANAVINIQQSIKDMAATMATKKEMQELNAKIESTRDELRTELSAKIASTREELSAKIESEVHGLADHVHTLFQQHAGSHAETRERLDGHESRLAALELKS